MKFNRKFLTSALAGILAVSSVAGMALTVSAEKVDASNLDNWYVADEYYDGVHKPTSPTVAPSGWDDKGGLHPYYYFNETRGYTGGICKTYDEVKTNMISKGKTGHASRHIWTHEITEESGTKKNAITFIGNSYAGLTDFAIYPSKSQDVKALTFVIDAGRVDNHTMKGYGALINAGINSNGNLDGYVLDFSVNGKIYLIPVNDVDPVKFHEGKSELSNSNGEFNLSKGTAIGTNPIGGSTGKMRITMEIWPTSVTLNSTIINNDGSLGKSETIQDVKLNDTGLYGFGPIVDYCTHGCDSLSYVEFSDIDLSVNYKVVFDSNAGAFADGSTLHEVLDIKPGDSVPASKWPANPTRPGYTFVGWSEDKSGTSGVMFNQNDPVNKGILNVYAVWEQEKAGINWDSGEHADVKDKGGNWVDKFEEELTTDKVIDTGSFPAVKPDDGYIHIGWEDKNGNTVAEIDDSGKLVMPNGPIKVDKDESYTFKPIIKEDKNGDGIPDDEQALYVVEFATDSKKGNQTGTDKYWVAGDKNSNPGDSLTLDNATITPYDKPGQHITGSLVPPTVIGTGNNAFDNKWNDGSKDWDHNATDTWVISKNTTMNSVFESDENGDGISDSKQTKYEVKFEAGSDGSVSGKTTATVIERGTTGGKGSDKLGNAIGGFTPPTAKPDAGYEFTGWVVKGTTGPLIDSADLEDEVISGDVTYVAQFVRSKPQGGGGVNGGFNITIQGPSNTTGGGTVEVMPGTKVGAANPPFVSPNDPKRYEVKTYTDQNGKSYTPDQIKNMVPTEDMTFTAVVTAKKR